MFYGNSNKDYADYFGPGRVCLCTMRYSICVNAKGIFYAPVKDELVHECAVAANLPWSVFKHGAFYAPTIDDLKELVIKWYRAAYECKVEETLVIRYSVSSQVSFARHSGGIHPNGVGAVEGNYDFETDPFFGGLSGSIFKFPAYSVAIGAQILKKQVITAVNGVVTIKYLWVDKESLGSHGYSLNSWCGLSLAEARDVKEIPYTEESAKFFNDRIMQLVQLADKLFSFFSGSTEEVQQRIRTSVGAPLHLTPESGV